MSPVKYLRESAGVGGEWEHPSLNWKEFTWVLSLSKPLPIGITGVYVAIDSRNSPTAGKICLIISTGIKPLEATASESTLIFQLIFWQDSREAARRGITRQSIIKVWLYDRLKNESSSNVLSKK